MTYSMKTRSLLLTGLAAALGSACVAKDTDSLGELDSEDGSAASGDETTDPTDSDTGTDSEGTPSCPEPQLDYYWPTSCGGGEIPELPAAGCYEACDGPGSACGAGVCAQVDIDPCYSPEGGETCQACGAGIWLCVEGLPDAVCNGIVGTSFQSIEEFICYPTPEGEEPVYCPNTIDFEEDGGFLWMTGDFGQGGDYTCIDGILSVGLDVEHSYDPTTEILTWDGLDYEPVP